jgi:hypothetical protein
VKPAADREEARICISVAVLENLLRVCKRLKLEAPVFCFDADSPHDTPVVVRSDSHPDVYMVVMPFHNSLVGGSFFSQE